MSNLQNTDKMENKVISKPSSKLSDVHKINDKPVILLVEDSPLIQHIHKHYLESMNCEVLIAENGSQALHLFENKPDLILLDVGLPGLSGIEVCRIIRSEEYLQRTPIIGLTAYGEIIEFECRAAGMDDFAVKPISNSNLFALIQRWLPQYQSVLKAM